MKHLSFSVARSAVFSIEQNSLSKFEDYGAYIGTAQRIVDLIRKDSVPQPMALYLRGVMTYEEIESWYSLTPAELRCIRAVRSFLTYVRNHGCKAPRAHVWIDLNTGVNICLVNNSIAYVPWELVPFDFKRIV